MTTEKDEDIFGPIIHSYGRSQGIEDGFLVDVTEMANEAGIRYPVSLTRGVYESYVTVPPKVRWQDEKGRLWDVLFMLYLAIRQQRNAREIRFTLLVRNDNRRARKVELKAVCGPDDEGAPCITVMHPHED